MERRAATVARIEALARDREGIVASASGVAVDDEHDPEGVTLGFERAHVESLLAGARARLAELDAALARAPHDLGTCEGCGGPIGEERLMARPETRVCVGCAARGSTR